MTDDTQPSLTRMCHRTGFTKKCRQLVSTGKCERWKILPVEEGDRRYNKGDCIDDWAFYFGYANERGLAQTTASLDHLRENVEKQKQEMARQHQEQMILAASRALPAPEREKFQHTINLLTNGSDDV